ncbi:MAG TPA: tyrosine-type recombinase/integrase [Urbifossiella sp.]|nr:tyrosine-type recombinase/integrase [Urbifossiella sp.]
MATIQERNGSYRILFVYAGKRETFTLGTVPRTVADAKAAKVDELLALLKGKYLAVPAGVPIVDFMRADGKAVSAEPEALPVERVTLGQLRDRYLTAHRQSLEPNTLSLVGTHFRQLVATWGERFAVGGLSLSDLQTHADRRASMKSKKGTQINPVTIRKDLVTLRTAWNWATHHGLVVGAFPALKHVRLGKVDEKPPFQTREEIERKLGLGATKVEADALWEALYLRAAEVNELTAHIKGRKAVPWLYPMVCVAAHTGARRSELLRLEAGDLDLAGGEITFRERKRSKGVRTTRRVSLSPFLAEALAEWMTVRPAGKFLFAQSGTLARSKKRGSGVGYQWGKERPTTTAGRKNTVTARGAVDAAPVTKDEAGDHFRRAVAGSKWEVMRGWHVLRHSFISALAAKGVDQRVIDEFVGHTTDEQRRRYRHLSPDVRRKAIGEVFG